MSLMSWILVPVLLLSGALAMPAQGATAGTPGTPVTADYANDAGAFDHSKYLNANEGGYLTHNALNWLPESYPKFKQAGLRMVAITHLLNENFYNVVQGTPPNLSYDFSKLDRVVLPLVEQGMTPLMGVAFTPHALGGADKATGYDNAIPNDNALWGKVVQAMVQHYKDLGHTGWYWEVWNEPDLGGFWAGTQAQYNAMYEATAEGVKNADPTAKIGGPTSTQGGWWFFDGFTAFLKANPDVPLDFASFHTYGPETTFAGTDAAKARLDAAGRPNVPIFITEWNITAQMTSGPGAPSDTNQGASYGVRRMADALHRPALTKVFWFSAKEGLQPTSLFNGDLGLVTVDGHKKAALNAFELMNKLQPRLIGTTSANDNALGAIVTKDPATGKVVLLAWNDQAAGTQLDLKLTNLPYTRRQNVKVTQYLIDSTHGNYYKDYADGQRGWSVGPTENADPVDTRITRGSSGFERKLTLGPYSVAAIELERTNADRVPPRPPTKVTRNLAQNRQVAASSAVPWGWSQAFLVDGLTHTFTKVDSGAVSNGWSSNGHPTADATEWVYVDLAGQVKFNRIKLHPRDDKECEGYGFPIDFTIQGSNDASTWKTLVTKSNYNDGKPLSLPVTAQTFDVSGTYQYVRVHATKLQTACAGDSTRYFQLAELQVEVDVVR
jgi:beta-xylosidase